MTVRIYYSLGVWLINEDKPLWRDMSPFNLALKVPNKHYTMPADYKPTCVGIVRLSSKKRQNVTGDLRILSRELAEVVKGKSEEERQ